MVTLPNPPTNNAQRPTFMASIPSLGHNTLDQTSNEANPDSVPSAESRHQSILTGLKSNTTRSRSAIAPLKDPNSRGNTVSLDVSRKPVSEINQPWILSRKQNRSAGSVLSGNNASLVSVTKDPQNLESTLKMGDKEPPNPSQHSFSLKTHGSSSTVVAAPETLREHDHIIRLRHAPNPSKDPTLLTGSEGTVTLSHPQFTPHGVTTFSSPAMTTNSAFSTMPDHIPVGSSAANTLGTTKTSPGTATDFLSTVSNVTVTSVGTVSTTRSVSSDVRPPTNASELPSTANGSFLNRLVPATTRGPGDTGNQSGPSSSFDSAHAGATICLGTMDIVWVLLAICVPVSSCCEYLVVLRCIGESKTDPVSVRVGSVSFVLRLLCFHF